MSAPKPRGFFRDNALSLVFGGLLLLTLLGQSLWGVVGYNQEARTAGLQQISLLRYVTSSSFAVDVAENWQSEFLQFVLYIFFTVWLVQRGSSESKSPGDEGRERSSPRWWCSAAPSLLWSGGQDGECIGFDLGVG
ncbi:hypothetical protein KMZ32_06330 [Phycicoccus sp. MAQZ13P-2]|uniref:DUF6766 family protein n=1 Tax=Phycicoccus mangrovi TaxID=2840470 RepID=UPI001C00509C|nr:DUF6766 family protein [Phycicoccus mangrovi]MBT9273687.1 hypothetical protein [Phycicoccus mangrovi]